ncbi:MAG: hypothetical protein NT006_03910 [Candidatus Aminicenantes bacterium]|jgi:hypothetical protein|nr:hypothetical protein [Candidatus Aminicenantes bacterium]
MSKLLRLLFIFLLIDAVAVGVYFLAKGSGSGPGADPTKDFVWTTMDAYYQPATELEQSIKTDYEEKGLLPFQFRNYGRNAAVLKKFRGSKLVGAGVPVLEMTFKGLEDWAVVDIWIKGENNREIRRTVLYVLRENVWNVADSGRLVE